MKRPTRLLKTDGPARASVASGMRRRTKSERGEKAQSTLVTPKDRENLIIFDWDDTLCPTTWIRQNLKSAMEDTMEFIDIGRGKEETAQTEDAPKFWDEIPSWFRHPLPHEPTYEEPIAELLKVVEEVLRLACGLGRVVVLTNAINGWVRSSAKQWLSPLRQLFLDLEIDVKYARHYPITTAEQPTFSQLYGKDEQEKMQSFREWIFTERKAKGMGDIINTASHTNYKNLVSVGDSQFEIIAMESASRRYHRTASRKRSFSAGDAVSLRVAPVGNDLQSAHRHGYGCIQSKRCYQKTIKMLDSPAINDMIAQLRTIRDCLPRLVDAKADFTCSTEKDPFDMGKLGSSLTRNRRAKSCPADLRFVEYSAAVSPSRSSGPSRSAAVSPSRSLSDASSARGSVLAPVSSQRIECSLPDKAISESF
jgi:hypothetical protein